MKKIHLDLFSGIGGFALAVDCVWPDVEHIFCDYDPFCQAVLKKHWPNSKIYGDIKIIADSLIEGLERSEQAEGSRHARQRDRNGENKAPFILTGGFPCQPFSQAGRRQGTADDRYLWPQMFAIIKRTLPEWVIAENVRGLVTWNEGMVLETVCADLESEGYEVQPFIIPACATGAPHRRDRIWIVANAKNTISERSGGRMENSKSAEIQNARSSWQNNWIEVATCLCRMDDGIPKRLDRNPRLKALGNAIVPQVAYQIMQAIKDCEKQSN